MDDISIKISMKGVEEVVMEAKSPETHDKVLALFVQIEPEIRSFAAKVKERLQANSFVADA